MHCKYCLERCRRPALVIMLNGFAIVGDLSLTIKQSVEKEGFLGWRYNTIGVSDGITLGNEGKCSTPSPPQVLDGCSLLR
jgi:hypothetical protein